MELTPVKGLIVACSPIFQVGTGEPCRLLQLAADDEHYTVALVEHATKELAIGLGISIREYIVHDDGWVSCHQSGVSSSPMDEGFQVAETIWSRFPGPPFNYQGRCTGIIDAGLRYELDEHLQLLYEGQLSVGEQYLFYNLCARERALRRELLTTACPLYTTVDRHECSSLSHRQWSIHDSFLWRRQAGEMRTILEGLLSSSHLRSVEGYTELGLRICRAIRGGVVSDPVIEFRRHCREGQCHYCAEPVLPQNFLTKDEACQSEICVSLLGLLSVCQVTGRPLLRAGSVELNLLLTPELQARHPWQFDHLAVCIDATVYRDNDLSFAILTQPPIYVAPIVARDSQTGPSKREKEGVRGRAASSPPQDLVLIKSLSSTPILLSKTGGMRMSMEGYKFGKLCLHRGKLEMVGQTAINLSISAAAAVRRALAPGAVIVLAPHESPDECKVLQYEAGDENAMAKEIRLISMDKYLIRLSCSPVAAAYLQESRDLLTSRLNAPSGVPPLVALVMSKEYVTAALLGLPQPVRSKVPYHIWGEKYLVVNLQCAFTRQRLCLPPGYLHPLGLVVGAKLNIYHCKSLKDLQGGPLLIPTSHTVIMFAGMQQQQGQSTGAIDVSALEYPIKFIHELSDFDYSTINGRFLRLLTFEAHARCHSCHAVLRASSCLSHGIMDQSRCELEIQALFCFTDGLEEVKVVISDVSILDRAGLITRDRLMEMAMSSVISVDYRLGGGAPETASGPNILLGPLRSLPFLMQDYHLIALALPASGLARLQALAIKPIDYFDQCRRLLAINREALLASPEKAYKPAVALSLDIIIRHGRDKLRIVKGPTGRAQITFKTSAGSTLYASAWTSRHPSRMHPHALLDLTHVPSPLLDHLMVLRNDRFLTLRTDRFSRDARELIRYLGRKRLSLYDFVLQMLRSSMQRPPSQGNRNRSRQRMVGGGSGFGPIALPPLLQELTRGMPKVVLKYLSRSLAHFGERVISHLFPEPWAEDSVVESQGSLSLRNDGEYDTIHVALTAKLLAIRINLHQ